MSEAKKRYADAVVVPSRLKAGQFTADRMDAVLAIAEPALGVDRSRGEKGWIRNHGETAFVTKDPADTLNFPNGHPRQGFPRYGWVAQPDGTSFGYLLKEATDAVA